MIALRALARVVTLLWLIVLGAVGLGVAMYCLDSAVHLGSASPDRLLGLPAVKRHIGGFLDGLAAPGSVAVLALICAIVAMGLGLLLILGLVGRTRERLVMLEHDAQGIGAARKRTLSRAAQALAGRAPDVTEVRRPRLRLGRRKGAGGRLALVAVRTPDADNRQVSSAVREALTPLTEPFRLKPRVRVLSGAGEKGHRVQ